MMGNIHEIKLNRQFFPDVASGKKTFALRKNDRNYKVGDTVIFKEWDGRDYIGGRIVTEITYILDEYTCIGLQPDYVILGIKILTI